MGRQGASSKPALREARQGRGEWAGGGARELWTSPTCLCQHLPNDAQATSPMRGCLLAVSHGAQGVGGGGGGAHGVGGNEAGARSGCCLCTSATVQTASYNDQMRENERKQICSSQANEYTYKRPTTRPSPMPATRSPPSPPTGSQLQTYTGISLRFLRLYTSLFSRMHYWPPESCRVFQLIVLPPTLAANGQMCGFSAVDIFWGPTFAASSDC